MQEVLWLGVLRQYSPCNTNCVGNICDGMVISFLEKGRKPSTTAVINGAISGLAGVTPAAGFITAQSSFLLGIVLGFASYYGILLIKEHFKIDDALDVSSVHGITGIVGSIAIGLVATTIINPNGPNGLLYGNSIQLAIQALGVAVAGYWLLWGL